MGTAQGQPETGRNFIIDQDCAVFIPGKPAKKMRMHSENESILAPV